MQLHHRHCNKFYAAGKMGMQPILPVTVNVNKNQRYRPSMLCDSDGDAVVRCEKTLKLIRRFAAVQFNNEA